MSDLAQTEDNLRSIGELPPLTEEEIAACFRAAAVINAQIAVPCTACSYCTAGCPKQIAIPQYFSLYNEDIREVRDKGWTVNFSHYEHLAGQHGRAGDCIACRRCEKVCPQHLPIVEALKKVSERYDHR